MRDLVLQMGISIDGKVSGGPGEGAGGTTDDDVLQRHLEWLSQVGVHGMGRGAYEEMAEYWQTSDHPFAASMNERPKVVFSKTLTHADWPTTTIARGDLAEEVARLKAEPGGEIVVYGGYRLAQALTRQDLVDQYRLVIRPVALGSGEPMFKDLATGRRLDLVECTPYRDGTVITIYRRS